MITISKDVLIETARTPLRPVAMAHLLPVHERTMGGLTRHRRGVGLERRGAPQGNMPGARQDSHARLAERAVRLRERRQQRGTTTSRFHAGIATCHAVALSHDATDWPRILWLYDTLRKVAPSPGVDVNRAFARGNVSGSAAQSSSSVR